MCSTLSQFFVSDRRTRAEEVLVSESVVNPADGWPQLGLRFHERLDEGANKQQTGKEIRWHSASTNQWID